MRVPDHLENWTYEVVKELARLGQPETDRHDFKAGLPDVHTLTKVCCCFANSKGGFIVLGVKERNNRFIPEGIDPDSEMAMKFGQRLKASPTVLFEAPRLLNVPDSEKVLYVFHIPRSPERPHIPSDADRRVFWKRTNTGCERMTLEEIRAEFMNYEERREKLKLLFIELAANKNQLSQIGEAQDDLPLLTLDSAVLERLLVDLYSILQGDRELVRILLNLREQIRVCNSKIQLLFSRMALSYSHGDKQKMVREHNAFMKQKAAFLNPQIDRALRVLEERFGLRDPFDTPVTPAAGTLTLEGH